MNGIDTGAAALLASRIAALTPVGSQGSAGAAQTGVSALATGTAALADTQAGTSASQDSAQTVLSAVALALDAIIRSGGEATPAVVGRAPLWASPEADAQTGAPGGAASLPLPLPPGGTAGSQAEAAAAALLADVAIAVQGEAAADLPDTAGSASTQAGPPAQGTPAQSGPTAQAPSAPQTGQSAPTTQTPQTAQTAHAAQTAAAAQTGPVAALAASLARTVSTSGLFYEAHLAQWLRGQRAPADLADEPQNRLFTANAQLSLDWAHASDDIDDVQWTELLSGTASDAQGSARGEAGNAANTPNVPNAPNMPNPADAGLARAFSALPEAHAEALMAQLPGQAQARAGVLLADTLLPAMHDATAQSLGASVHASVIPLVRQQLDLLATGEFRWNGEAWPGVRVDWSIQQDEYEARDPRHGSGADGDDIPWRTRLTLALPKLGTVDAELTLTGATLAVRVQASTGGAARLNAESEALRGRLEALGLTLAGLSIREIGSGVTTNAAEAARAASAYAAQTEPASAAAGASHAPNGPNGQNGPGTPEKSGTRDAAGANDQDWEL
ncbi:flagellar hook-length control protein FliK [Paraburkholderia unamae]|uniref:Flagellar hook-length control protein FliK n=1 Tax=Paraburkholderia unamae TaxID=219649 RepID=A0ABX5KYB1_9BURK|nr:flagellar hook-length control protein FliK [Paraburkholderia unamae]PVX97360.1 flagellar hook-length control protein FliK [Paraburkholderia unamae]CAG9255956.1 Ribonuclease E [Paraburkholderia unamae]